MLVRSVSLYDYIKKIFSVKFWTAIISTWHGLVCTPFALYPRSVLVLVYNSPFALYDIAKMDYWIFFS